MMIRPHKTRSFHLSIPAQADKHFLLDGFDETYHGGTRPPGEISFDVTLASLFKGLRKNGGNGNNHVQVFLHFLFVVNWKLCFGKLNVKYGK